MTPTQLSLPLARATDPDTSHDAARSVAPANEELIRRIRLFVHVHGPVSREEIAFALMRDHPGRWTEGTIVTACSRAGLQKYDRLGVTSRGRPCELLVLRTITMDPL